MATHTLGHYDESSQLDPPPCLEQFHHYWIEYLRLRSNMWVAAVNQNYEEASRLAGEADDAFTMAESSNPFK